MGDAGLTLSHLSSPQTIRIYSLFPALCISPGFPPASLESLGFLINGESNGPVLVSGRRAMSEGPCLLTTQKRRFFLDCSGSSTGTDD